MNLLIIFLMMGGLAAEAGEAQMPSANPSQDTLLKVYPLDESTDRVLQKHLPSRLEHFGEEQRTFRNMIVKTAARLTKERLVSGIDDQEFVYDCLFMNPDDLHAKYRSLDPKRFQKAQKIVAEAFGE